MPGATRQAAPRGRGRRRFAERMDLVAAIL